MVEDPHIRRYHVYDRARDAQGDRRAHAGEPDDRLRDGRRRSGAAGDRAARGEGARCSSGDDLAWGDLSRFDAIVTGVRAYERRDDLRANNSRLLEYVFNGGTVIVQYNKFEFNDAQYGPYPAK